MRKRVEILIVMAIPIAVFVTLIGSATARPLQSGGEVIVCTLTVGFAGQARRA